MSESARRVFLSYTSELRKYPEDGSFVDAMEKAVVRVREAPVDMAHFTAGVLAPAALCRERVAECDVYVLVAGFRYGSPVVDRPSLSYTELEFEAATELGKPRLVFLLDQQAQGPGVLFLDPEFGDRQEAFRRRLLLDSGLVVKTVRSPVELDAAVVQALTELQAITPTDTAASPVKPEPLTRRTVGTRGYGDRPATEDLLRRHGMLQAFRALVMPQNHVRGEEHAGPTVIALDGAWGVGKTSVIDLSAKLLKHGPRLDVPAEKVERMNAWAARQALGGRGEALWTEKMVPRVSENGMPSLVTSRFEPWAHQTGEQVWAGLTRTLLGVVNERFLRDDEVIERYWFQRNIERVDRARLRRSLLKEAASPLFAVTFLALLVPIVAQMARSTDFYRILGLTEVMGSNIAWIIVAVALAAGIGNLIWRYRRPAADYLPAELFVGPITSTAFADGNGDEALRDPYRNARSGYLYLLQHDVFAALDDVKKAGHHIVLFVDDLDRCSSRTTAEVFEAINLFVNRTFPVTRFVLCLDTTAVAAHLDETHSALRGKPLDTDDPSPGWSFLRKLVQLTIPIPVISPNVLEDLVDQLLPKSVTDVDAQVATAQATAEPAQEHTSPGQQNTSTTPLQSEARTSATMELLEHDDEVRARIVDRLRAQPVRSVREVKRILTAWQYFVRVLIVLRTAQPVSVEEAKQLVVLAEISARWPAAQRALRRNIDGKCGLGWLAAAVDDEPEWAWTLRKFGLHTEPHEKCATGLRELLRRYNGVHLAELAAELH